MSETHEKHDVKAYLVNDKGTWTVIARVYDPKTGKVRKRSKSTKIKFRDDGRGKRKAEKIMKEIQAEWEKEANTDYVEAPLFADYVEYFISKKEVSREQLTAMSYRGYAENPILPYFGDIKVTDVRRRHLEAFLKEMLKTRKVNTIKKYFVVINGALKEARRDGLIEYSFWEDIEFPKQEKFEKKFYTPEQVSALLEAVKNEGEPIMSAVILGACYGLRREEVCGLRWQDIDFEKKTMVICNTVTTNYGVTVEKQRTKTAAGHRTLSLIDSTVEYLQSLLKAQIDAHLMPDKVCRWPSGKNVLPTYITSRFSKILKKYGLPHIRFHDLRHTVASFLLAKTSMYHAKEYLGHEDVSMTVNIYGSLLDNGREEMADIMNGYYTNVSLCSENSSEEQFRHEVNTGQST